MQDGRIRFFVDDRVNYTVHAALTPMEIKTIAGVPLDWNLAPEFVRHALEARASIFLRDDELVSLTGEPKRFHASPQARF